MEASSASFVIGGSWRSTSALPRRTTTGTAFSAFSRLTVTSPSERVGRPAIETMVSPALTPAFSASEPGQTAVTRLEEKTMPSQRGSPTSSGSTLTDCSADSAPRR